MRQFISTNVTLYDARWLCCKIGVGVSFGSVANVYVSFVPFSSGLLRTFFGILHHKRKILAFFSCRCYHRVFSAPKKSYRSLGRSSLRANDVSLWYVTDIYSCRKTFSWRRTAESSLSDIQLETSISWWMEAYGWLSWQYIWLILEPELVKTWLKTSVLKRS